MKKRQPPSKKEKVHPLAGKWVNINPYESEVEFTISIGAKGATVKARDPNDGETAKISGVELARDSLSRECLSFTCHWRSTGRITVNRISLISSEHVQLTFTYTDSSTLVRTSSK